LIWRVSSSLPRPKPSTPALLEMTVRSLRAGVLQRLDQRLGNAAQAEAADGEHLPVGHDALERRVGGGIKLVHGLLDLVKSGWVNLGSRERYYVSHT
jgi:hypothetical protein